ncbi:MAG: VOC family protein [Polyangiaceae bacterium]
MPKASHHIPTGLSAVITQLVVPDAHALVAFAKAAFDANDVNLMPGPDGKGVMHGFFRIGGVAVFCSDIPGFAKPTQSNLFVYVPDVDSVVAAAEKAGAKVKMPVADMFWGDRWGMIEDPWGNLWQIATHTEDVSPEEMQKRMAAQAAS